MERVGPVSRRSLLSTAVTTTAGLAIGTSLAGLLVSKGLAAVAADPDNDEYDFLIPRVKFSCSSGVIDVWNTHPGAERNLLEELSSVVRCKVKLPKGVNCDNPYFGEEKHFNAVVTFDDIESVRKFPFLLITAEGYYDFNAAQKANLKRYLDEGGFMLMDDCVFGMGADYFYQSSVKLLTEVFGRGSVSPIPKSHEVFHNVYDFGNSGLPHVSNSAVYHDAQGVAIGNRLAVFLSSVDIHCGWVDRNHRWYQKNARGTYGYEESIKMGINTIMYAMSH